MALDSESTVHSPPVQDTVPHPKEKALRPPDGGGGAAPMLSL
jgi:hypothetical protein